MTADTNDKRTGRGLFKPLDSDAYVEIIITGSDGLVESAAFECGGGETAERCAETVCRVITGQIITDIFQMNNNAVYYNIEPELKRNELFNASVAVMAAKRAAADWCRKNGVNISGQTDCCGCDTE